MAEQAREIYRTGQPDLDRILARIMDRLDQIEGMRGTPTFAKTAFVFADAALTAGQVLQATSATAAEIASLDASSLVGTLAVAHGGTGAASLTDHGVLTGSGTDPVTALAVGTNGQLLLGSTGADPVFATLGTGTGLSTTLGAGALTISLEAGLAAISALAKADGNIIVGNGATWVAESGDTARTSLGLGSSDGPTFDHLHITNNVAAGSLNVATFAVTVEAASAMNQDLTSDASPTFATVKCSGLTDGFVPKHTADATGLQDSVLKQDAGGGIVQSTNCLRMFVSKTTISDNTATSVFRITTTDEASNDGGGYSCRVHALIGHALSAASAAAAAKGFVGHFCHEIDASGNAANSAVVEVTETASAADASATRDISTVTMTVLATSAYLVDVQFTIDLTGTSVSTATVDALVELVWRGFTTPPTISAL